MVSKLRSRFVDHRCKRHHLSLRKKKKNLESHEANCTNKKKETNERRLQKRGKPQDEVSSSATNCGPNKGARLWLLPYLKATAVPSSTSTTTTIATAITTTTEYPEHYDSTADEAIASSTVSNST
eukprot:TRINITY_DN32307_c0_g1_i1.p1 TRINITY_DN32307_c0_g1~~TRINITY_DN32307_c0_g1_i1.p1  ORF type:complete len:125 (+),score=2.07 TRINITY_DN32307_c0_g1_i1:49-423(+)